MSTYWLCRVFEQVKLDRRSGCWVWTGAMSVHGYGLAKRGKFYTGISYPILAYRLTFHWFVSPVETMNGQHLDHMCRNRACCNPAHLDLVPAGENSRRRWLSRRTHRQLIKQPR